MSDVRLQHSDDGSSQATEAGTRRRPIGPIGTGLRVLFSAALFADLFGVGKPPQPWPIVFGFLGAIAVMVGWQAAYGRLTGRRLNATGPIAYLLIFAVAGVMIWSRSPEWAGVVAFIAASALLGAVRGYAGCEITAISNWLLRRDDQVGCVVFSPVDRTERHWRGTVR